ncbi:MAG: hypothetical protein NO483_06920 [Candidatus Methanomethylicia archaeon]|nr:hypothetical protein [Candidatus Methanomethylicia archaeon]
MKKKEKKKERYIDKWRKEHPRVQFYLSKEEYNTIKKIAEEKGITIKDLILESIKGKVKDFKEWYEKEVIEEYRREYSKGFLEAINKFIDHPIEFYYEVMKRANITKPRNFEPALFTAPCSICGKPMIFTHKDKNWNNEIKPKLLDAFKNWCHVECERLYST